MSNRNLTNVLSLVAVALIGTAITSPASANAGHYNVTGSYYFDTGSAARGSGSAPTCYTEPTGFHKNIRWDDNCRNSQKPSRTTADEARDSKSTFVEPNGFHYNVRSR